MSNRTILLLVHNDVESDGNPNRPMAVVIAPTMRKALSQMKTVAKEQFKAREDELDREAGDYYLGKYERVSTPGMKAEVGDVIGIFRIFGSDNDGECDDFFEVMTVGTALVM